MIVGRVEIIHPPALHLLQSGAGRGVVGIDVEDLVVGAFRTVVVAELAVALGDDELGLDEIDVPQVPRAGREIVAIVALLQVAQHLAQRGIDFTVGNPRSLGEGDDVGEGLFAFGPLRLVREDEGVTVGRGS